MTAYNFHLDASRFGNSSVSWNNESTRFHVWLDDEGALASGIYANDILDHKKPTRHLDIDAKCHAKLKNALGEFLGDAKAKIATARALHNRIVDAAQAESHERGGRTMRFFVAASALPETVKASIDALSAAQLYELFRALRHGLDARPCHTKIEGYMRHAKPAPDADLRALAQSYQGVEQ